MIVGLSEFMFGYAFLYEQTHNNWPDLTAAPILPSLQHEYDEGWDAHLPLNGTDFYYQFKLSDYLFNHNAKYIRDGTYANPYYRLALHHRHNNRQHRRLRILSSTNPNTFYVAPEFNDIDTFNAAFLQHQIVNRSRMIPVNQCVDINDSDQHYITFRQNHPAWIQHSEPKRNEESFTGKDIPGLYRASQQDWRPVTHQFAVELFNKTTALVDRVLESEKIGDERPARPALLDFDARPRERREVLRRTSEILSVLLGVTLVIVGERAPVQADQQ